MFLSIVIPIWNDEKYLNECLDSCLDQDLSKDDYEIICVDDGSTDRTPEILREYAERYTNIQIITKQHGRQFGSGRTIGYQAARGDYIWFVDHDDIVAPGAIDELLSAARENPDYTRIAFPCYEFFDSFTPEEWRLFHEKKLNCNDKNIYQDSVTWSSIIRRSFLTDNDILPRSKRIDQAAAFWNISDYQIWGGDTIFIDECIDKGIRTLQIEGRPLYHYRRHDNTQTMSNNPEVVKMRRFGKYCTALLFGYVAIQNKTQYQEEQTLNGSASPETTFATILRQRKTIMYLTKQPRKEWKSGIELLNQKGFFFLKTPAEYSFRLRDYLRNQPLTKRIRPSVIAAYYLFTKRGALAYRFFTALGRKRANNELVIRAKKAKKQRRLLKLGTTQQL